MHQFAKRIFVAAAPLLLTGCLWGPGKFASDLTLKKDGSFVLDYRGEIVLQMPPDMRTASRSPGMPKWCAATRTVASRPDPCIAIGEADDGRGVPSVHRGRNRQGEVGLREACGRTGAKKRKETEEMAKMFGLPGVDDESNRAFAAKLEQICRLAIGPVSRKGRVRRRLSFRGPRDAGLRLPGDARQRLPDSLHRHPPPRRRLGAGDRALVTGGAGPLGARARAVLRPAPMKDGPVSKARRAASPSSPTARS